LLTDTIVESVDYDARTRRARGVRVRHRNSGACSMHTAKIIFLCAGSINSVSILLRSRSEAFPHGLGNSSGLLGKFVMDHAHGALVESSIPAVWQTPFRGKPNGFVIPRFVNVTDKDTEFLRGYSLQGFCKVHDSGADDRGLEDPIGDRGNPQEPQPCMIAIWPCVECLPRRSNQIRVDFNTADKYRLPLTHIDVRWSDNERLAARHAHQETRAMLSLLGGNITVATGITGSNEGLAPPGTAIHEMGGACMGHDRRRSVTNAHNQLHDASNVFVTDGASMNSTGDRSPSLTYMAFTARAAAHAVSLLKTSGISP
jgi:choline dehydrogenase-like flavoprotein